MLSSFLYSIKKQAHKLLLEKEKKNHKNCLNAKKDISEWKKINPNDKTIVKILAETGALAHQ